MYVRRYQQDELFANEVNKDRLVYSPVVSVSVYISLTSLV